MCPSRDSYGAPPSLRLPRVFVITIRIPKKKTSSPKPNRKPGTRAGLTKSRVAAAAIHAHFKGGTGAISSAVAVQMLAGTTRPFKPKEEPAEYLRELLLKVLLSLHARPEI